MQVARCRCYIGDHWPGEAITGAGYLYPSPATELTDSGQVARLHQVAARRAAIFRLNRLGPATTGSIHRYILQELFYILHKRKRKVDTNV